MSVKRDDSPVAKIRRIEGRGIFMRWESWVDTGNGLTSYAGEFGTFSITKRAATRKARRLYRKYTKTTWIHPEEVVS